MNMASHLSSYQRGIVLRSFLPERNKVVIFDQLRGRSVSCVTSRAIRCLFMQGSMISYLTRPWRDSFIIEHAELCSLPHLCIREQIHFIHQMCELGLFFLAEADIVHEVFDLYSMVYDERAQSLTEVLQQQLFFCKFFACLGIYPEESLYTALHVVRSMVPLPFEVMVRNRAYDVHDVRAWVNGCIQTHPEMRMLRTVPYR